MSTIDPSSSSRGKDLSPNNTPNVVQLNVEDGVGVVTMSRPKKRNAFTAEFLECMTRIIGEPGDRRDVDALIFTGTDGVFNGGGNVKGMKSRIDQKHSISIMTR